MGERTVERRTYSGFCPTSTKAIDGLPSAVKAALIAGRAARTSGHHDCFVFGSSEVIKATNKFPLLPGTWRASEEAGREKSFRIGIFECSSKAAAVKEAVVYLPFFFYITQQILVRLLR